jgi:hypothetical protein
MQRIEFTVGKRHHYAGMGDFALVSPDGQHELMLIYDGEPPHGDSYHRASIDGKAYPGHVWGCMFAFSSCSRYLAFSAMPAKFERRTALVDLEEGSYFLLPQYIHQFELDWPRIIGNGPISAGISYVFNGIEVWSKL